MRLKKLKSVTAVALTALTVLSGSYAYAAANTIKINGTVAEIPADMGKISEKDGRTFVPVRFVSEHLQNKVWYDPEVKSACVASASSFIYIPNGNTTLFIVSLDTNEVTQVAMDTSAYIDPEDNRTYLPIRFLAEALGFTVGWDEETQTVTLDKN